MKSKMVRCQSDMDEQDRVALLNQLSYADNNKRRICRPRSRIQGWFLYQMGHARERDIIRKDLLG